MTKTENKTKTKTHHNKTEVTTITTAKHKSGKVENAKLHAPIARNPSIRRYFVSQLSEQSRITACTAEQPEYSPTITEVHRPCSKETLVPEFVHTCALPHHGGEYFPLSETQDLEGTAITD